MKSLSVLNWKAVLLSALSLAWAGQSATFYVAANGNDAWSGTLASPNANGSDGPFASLSGARNVIRSQRQQGRISGPLTVEVRQGIYSLPQGLKFEAQDGGSSSAQVVWKAFPNEKPVLCGGRTISGFVPYKDGILKADTWSQGFRGVNFHQLVFDGRRQQLARYPNYDKANPYGGGWAYADGKLVQMYQDVPGEDRRSFQCKQEDVRRWSRPAEVEVFVFARYNWWNNICPIATFDSATRQVKLAKDASYPIRPGDRYYFQNALEELDAPGEWYLDKETGTLYFRPPAPLEGRVVMAPTTRTIMEIGPGTSFLTVRGLTFECAEGTAITLRQTTNCLVSGNAIRNVGDYNGSGVSVDGGRDNGVDDNDIYEIGSHGIHIGGGDRKTLAAAGNHADNNYIHHVGVYYKQGVGISLTGVGNRAAHNLIHDGPRMGIMFSGNNLVIEYNHIRHMNLETEDTGAVYTGGRDWISSRGTVVRYNYFHDILGYGRDDKGRWVSPHFAWGVYLDDNTGGVDVIGNIVVRCPRAALHLHNGRDNLIMNNIFVESQLQMVEYSGWTDSHRYWKEHLPSMIKGYEMTKDQPAWQSMRHMDLHPTNAVLTNRMIMASNDMRCNIMYWTNSNARLCRYGSVSFDHNVTDSNIVWHAGLPVRTGVVKSGRDVTSNLIANPHFDIPGTKDLPKGWSWQACPKGTRATVVEEPGVGKVLRLDGSYDPDAQQWARHPQLTGTELPVKPGASYRLKARVKAAQADTRISLMMQSYVANAYFWSSSPSDIKATTQWKEYEFSFRFPVPGDKVYSDKMKTMRVRIDFQDKTGTVWMDNVSLTEVEPMDEWASLQSVGFDRHSIIADPQFVNPAGDDYRLQPASPALKMGFQPIPVEKIGPQPSAFRASWPVVEAEGAREKPLVTR